jgi:DNA-binding response OmpR family regulator
MPADLIAVADDSPDCVGMLVAALQLHGLRVVGGRRPRPGARPPAFLASAPRVVIYDIPPPYQRELETFRDVRRDAFGKAAVILTTTHGGRLQKWLTEGEVLDVCLKPCEVGQLVAAIRMATAD